MGFYHLALYSFDLNLSGSYNDIMYIFMWSSGSSIFPYLFMNFIIPIFDSSNPDDTKAIILASMEAEHQAKCLDYTTYEMAKRKTLVKTLKRWQFMFWRM